MHGWLGDECLASTQPAVHMQGERFRVLLVLTERAFVGDDLPGFFFGEDISLHEGRHAGAGTAVFNDPKQFAIVSLLVKLTVGEVSGARG